MELAEREWSNAEEIKQVKQQHAKNLRLNVVQASAKARRGQQRKKIIPQ